MPRSLLHPSRGLAGALLLAAAPLALAAPATNQIVSATIHTQDSDRGAGDLLQFAIPLAGLGMAVARDDGDGMTQWSYDMLASIATTEILKKGFNHTSWGTRPDGGQNSFPSGHTTLACAGAGFIGRRYGWEYGAAAMAPAAFVAWSRVDEGVHHWRDVAAGCAVGMGMSWWLVNPEAQKITVLPEFYPHGAGINFTMRY